MEYDRPSRLATAIVLVNYLNRNKRFTEKSKTVLNKEIANVGD